MQLIKNGKPRDSSEEFNGTMTINGLIDPMQYKITHIETSKPVFYTLQIQLHCMFLVHHAYICQLKYGDGNGTEGS